MFKRDLGISVYPEKVSKDVTKKYLKESFDLGYEKVFISLFHMDDQTFKKNKDTYLEIIKYASELGFYIIGDINDSTLAQWNISIDELNKFREMGINCLRLDGPLPPKKVADISVMDFGLDFQVNTSGNDSFLENIIDYKPRLENLYGCHNFYPLKNSALPYDFFKKCNERLMKQNIHNSAFIGSMHGTHGPQAYEIGPLVTLEEHRNWNPRTQAKFLFFTNEISSVFFGNFPASNDELKEVANTPKLTKLELDIKLQKNVSAVEKEIITYTNHFRRGDITEKYVRSTMSRVDFKTSEIKPNALKNKFNYGDVCIINSNLPQYKGELLIILEQDFIDDDNILNFVGTINNEEKSLIQFIEPWTHFNLRIVD